MKEKQKTIVIMDGNNVAYGIYSRFKESKTGLLTSGAGIPTTVIFGMLRSLSAFCNTLQVDRSIIAWDVKGGSKWRKSIFPHYKANRSGSYDDMQDYFDELESARQYLKVFGINQAPCEGIEADDVIGWLTKKYEREGWRVIVYSNDKDYYQLVNKNVKIWRPVTEKIMDTRSVYELRKMSPRRLYLIDGLVGQQKDNIPGACDLDADGVMQKYGLGEGRALKLFDHPENPHQTLSAVHRILKGSDNCPVGPKFKEQLLKNWKQVVLSAKLSRIRTRDRHYADWEMEKLQEVYNQSMLDMEVSARTISNQAIRLDIQTIDVVKICRSIGVNVKGKGRERKKIKLRVG